MSVVMLSLVKGTLNQMLFTAQIRVVQRVQDPFKPPKSDRPEAQRVGLKPLAGRVRFLLSGNPNIRFGLRVKGLKTRTNRPDRSFKRKKKFWTRGRSRELKTEEEWTDNWQDWALLFLPHWEPHGSCAPQISFHSKSKHQITSCPK